MKRDQTKLSDLEELIMEVDQSSSAYTYLLDEYSDIVKALKSSGDIYPLDHAIDLQAQCDSIKPKLPNVSDQEFDKYSHMINLLGVLLE